MQGNPAQLKPVNYHMIGKKVDRNVLSLFPSFNFWDGANTQREKNIVLQRLACLYVLGRCGSASLSELTKTLSISRSAVARELKKLVSLSLAEPVKKGKTRSYILTTKGLVALMAFGEFRDWARTRAVLCSPQKKNQSLAYALLLIGYSVKDKTDTIYNSLLKYATQGHNMELASEEIAAESLLSFYSAELRASGSVPPNYLGVFKEFTTNGFQDVFRMLLAAIKPTADDYNWLIEFFDQVAEFYYYPARVAYVNLLSDNQSLKSRLEEFKKAQDQLIKKEGSTMEVTFTVPGSGLKKIDTMPPHLRAMGMRLMLEPMRFINKELCDFFWTK